MTSPRKIQRPDLPRVARSADGRSTSSTRAGDGWVAGPYAGSPTGVWRMGS
jgi:hypothetical protein